MRYFKGWRGTTEPDQGRTRMADDGHMVIAMLLKYAVALGGVHQEKSAVHLARGVLGAKEEFRLSDVTKK